MAQARFGSCVPLPLEPKTLINVLEKAKDWALMHGVGMRDKKHFTKDHLQVTHDELFLEQTLQNALQVDEFTAKLFDIWIKVRKEGMTQVPETVELSHVRLMQGSWTVESVMEEVVAAGQEDPFYVMDLGVVVARYQRWVHLMPRVTPYYAVNCNDDKLLLSTLAALGTGFDCASKTEIQRVTSLGVHPERIIFANPAKLSSHIRRAAALGVDIMTFDSEIELQKIKQLMPDAQLVIRIRCDAESARCPLGMKFGYDARREAPILLKLAVIN